MTPEQIHLAGLWVRAVLGDVAAEAACVRAKAPLTRAAGENINTIGGFLVPSAIGDQIFSLRDKFGLFRRNAFTPPMTREVVSWPRSLGNVTASWTAENAAAAESTGQFDNVNLVAKKLLIYIRASSELVEDSSPALGAWFVEEVARAFGQAEDQAGFGGDGTSVYAGIRGLAKLIIDGSHNASKVTAAGGHNTYALLDATDIGSLIGTLPARALPNAAFYVSNVGFGAALCRLASAAGGIANIGGEPVFSGFPVRVTPTLPTSTSSISGQTMILFGDLRQSSMLADRRAITVAVSDSRYLDQDQIALRASERVDLVNHDVGDNSVAGAVVGLVAP